MLRNYFNIAFRNMRRHWGYSGINLFGLTVGLACGALVLLYVSHELSYDNFHHDSENTIRIAGKNPGTGWKPIVSLPYVEAIREVNFPEIKHLAQFRRTKTEFGQVGDKRFAENKVLITYPGSEFFRVFGFEFLAGNPITALETPYSVVLSESAAIRYFGSAEDAFQQTLTYDTLQLHITGIIEDVPSNCHIYLDLLYTDQQKVDEAWGMFTYARLVPDADQQQLFQKIKSISPASVSQYDEMSDYIFQPIQSIHFDSHFVYELKPSSNKAYIYIFSVVGILILLISCINYTNLSIAIYASRNKEIGMRKVLGASKGMLAWQFWFEAVLLALIAVPLALVVLEISLGQLQSWMGIELQNAFLYSFYHLSALILTALLTGSLAGAYPALILPRLHTLQLFRGNAFKYASGSVSLRKALVVVQFSLLIALGSGAWLVNEQLQFMRSKDLGFDQTAVLKIKKAWDLDSWENYIRLKTALLSNPNIINVTTGMAPGDDDYGFQFKGENSDEVYNDVISFGTDLDYFETLGIEGKSSTFFDISDEEKPNQSFLVNETVVKRLGYDDPIGRTITLNPGTPNERKRTIDGVFADFHYFSLHQPVVPQFIYASKYRDYVGQNILIKVHPQDLQQTRDYISQAWYSIVPDVPLDLIFMDEDIQRHYSQEDRLANFSVLLSSIAIILALLGLIGLSAYMTRLRLKEVGIRKVLGASIPQLLNLLNKEFVWLIGIAMIIAAVLSYFSVSQWLQAFEYRISIQPLVFLFSGLIAMGLATLAVSYQSLRAALVNPVEVLRDE